MRCGCRRNSNTCGPGCRCQGCTNLPVANQELHTGSAKHMDSDKESSSDDDESEQSEDEETEKIVTEAFDHLLVDLPDIT